MGGATADTEDRRVDDDESSCDDDDADIAEKTAALLASLSLNASQRASLRIPTTHERDVTFVVPSGGSEYAHFHCPKTLPVPEAWPTRPLLVRNSATEHSLPRTSTAPPLPLGEPFDIDNDVFVGRGMLRIRGTPGTDDYFKGEHLTGGHVGKQMLSSFVVTGRFKRSLGFADLYTGQEFCHPIVQPGGWTQYAVLKAIKYLAPLLKVSLSEDEGTYLLSPLVQTAQAMNVGRAPAELTPGLVVTDDLSLLGEEFANKTQKDRKAYFSDETNLAKFAFDPELAYTFDFFDHNLSMSDFELNILGTHDLCYYLNGQPIRLMSRVVSSDLEMKEGDSEHDGNSSSAAGAAAVAGLHAWNIEVWNERQIAAKKEDS